MFSLLVLYGASFLEAGLSEAMAATSFILVGISTSMDEAQRILIQPVSLMAVGLATALVSSIPSLLTGSHL